MYIWLTALPFVGRALILHQIGYARNSISAIAGLKIAIFSIALLPIMYAFSRDRIPLGLTELFGGAAWGLFEISLIVYIQSQFKGRARSITGLHNCIMAGGAALVLCLALICLNCSIKVSFGFLPLQRSFGSAHFWLLYGSLGAIPNSAPHLPTIELF